MTARPLAPRSTKFSSTNSGTPTDSFAGLPACGGQHLSPASSSQRLFPQSEPEANLGRDRQLRLPSCVAHLLPADTPRTSMRHLGSHLDQATTQTPAGFGVHTGWPKLCLACDTVALLMISILPHLTTRIPICFWHMGSCRI